MTGSSDADAAGHDVSDDDRGAGDASDAAPDGPTGSSGRDPRDELGQFIRAQRESARMSVRRLAELAGVSNPYLSQIERGLRRPSADILSQLASALRISAETLYVQAGFLHDDAAEHRPDVETAIEHDPDLTPEQKAALVNVYRSFLGRDAGSEEFRPSR